MFLPQLLAPTLTLTVSLGQVGDAPERLITPHGLELVSDGRLFVLYAALNGLGFSEETERKGPPLAAPVFHPLRVEVREGMRKLDEEGKLADLRKFFEASPNTLETYAAAVLSHDLSLSKATADLTPDQKKLGGVMPLLEKLGADPELTKLFDKVADAQRKQARELGDRLEKVFGASEKSLALTEFRADPLLVVLPNPLDAQGAVRRFRVGGTLYLLVGPGLESASEAVLKTTLRAFLAPHVTKAWPNTPKLKKAWEDVRRSKAIQAGYPDGDAYVTDNLTEALSFQILTAYSGQNAQTKEEDFADAAQKHGLRWARVMLGALEGRSGPIDAAIPKILARAAP